MAFSFGFSGDDIDAPSGASPSQAVPDTQHRSAAKDSAFPVQGKPQLPPIYHDLKEFLSQMPSKIAYSTIDVDLDDGSRIQLPRRELWDVRVQLMAEDDGGEEGTAGGEGLGDHDVKTGVYEGGFKSWESSVDLVKVLATQNQPSSYEGRSARFIEVRRQFIGPFPLSFRAATNMALSQQLGCGTGLPSLALFTWALASQTPSSASSYTFILADYNPSVLQLVTLPNFILAWALHRREKLAALEEAFNLEDELELTPSVLQTFQEDLARMSINLSFLSGGWSPDFIDLLYTHQGHLTQVSTNSPPITLLLGAETIYSPFALQAFEQAMLSILDRERKLSSQAAALVGAKKLYFGVGGSLDDFVDSIQTKGVKVTGLREESEGVRRGVVRCELPIDNEAQ